MKVFGYVRVSTSEQATSGDSLETQKNQIVGYAMMKGWQIEEIFVEAGVSGSTPLAQREAGNALLYNIKSGDAVITAKLDRMFRSARDALETLEALKSDGISLHMIDLGGDVAMVLHQPLPNLWLGVSVEDRKRLPRIDDLRATPAATAQLSAQLHAAARAQQDVYPLPDDAPADDSTDSSDNSELIALMMAAGAFDGSVGVLARGPWRAPKFDFGFDLDDDELQRAAGFACLATLCIFMARARAACCLLLAACGATMLTRCLLCCCAQGVLLGRYMYEPEEEVEEEVDEEAGACKAAEKDEGTSKSCGTDDDGAATARAHGGATRAGDDGGADYHALPALPYSVA